MPKRRRLSDLYVRGQELVVNDDSGQDPIKVWVQKLNPLEQENALRRGSAERAKLLIQSKDRESEHWQAKWGDLQEVFQSRDQLLEVGLRDELSTLRAKIEAEVAGNERWSEDNHLQSLSDAWHGTTHDTDDDGAEQPSDHDADGENEPLRVSILRGEEDHRYAAALAVKTELEAWGTEVDDIYLAERTHLFADYDDRDEAALLDLATEKMIEQDANTAMLDEFQTQELFYAVRDFDDHSKRYFGTREEILSMQPQIRTQILAVYRALYVDPTEGKGLPGTPGSSPQSDLSVPEETPISSGLAV